MSSSSVAGEEGLHEIASQMRKSEIIQNRTYRLRKYKKCFIGSEAVDWMVRMGHAPDRLLACALGQAMMNAGLIHHVVWEHQFEDQYYFYRFVKESKLQGSGQPLRDSAGTDMNQFSRYSDGSTSLDQPIHARESTESFDDEACDPTRISDTPSDKPSFIQRALGLMETKETSSNPANSKSDKSEKSLLSPSHSFKGDSELLAAHVPSLTTTPVGGTCTTIIPRLPEKEMSLSRSVFATQLVTMQTKVSRLTCAVEELQTLTDRLAASDANEVALTALADLESKSVPIEDFNQLRTEVAALSTLIVQLSLYLRTAVIVASTALVALMLGVTGVPALAVTLAVSMASVWWIRPWKVETGVSGGQSSSLQEAASYESARSSGSLVRPQGPSLDRSHPLRSLPNWSRMPSSHSLVDSLAAVNEEVRQELMFREAQAELTGPPEIADFYDWPDAPICMTPNTARAGDQVILSDLNQRVPSTASNLNSNANKELERLRSRSQPGRPSIPRLKCNSDAEPVYFETDLFKGVAIVYLKGLPSTKPAQFEGVKRHSWIAIQGKFKTPISVDTLITGQEFDRPFEGLPPRWLLDKVFLSLAARINPSMRVGAMSAPTFMMPLISSAQLFNVSREGEAPPPMAAEEDCRLLLLHLVKKNGEPVSSSERRSMMSKQKDRVGYRFGTEHVVTFHLYQNQIDMATMSLAFAGQRVGMSGYLAGQPLQLMTKDEETGKYLYNFDLWHESLIRS